MKSVRAVFLATKNEGKRREFAKMLQGVFEVRSLSELRKPIYWEESGETFEENALIKARAVAALTDDWVLADDSGIEIDVLGGKPGVYSARWAGTDRDDAMNRRKVLTELKGVPPEKRTARFVCVLALIDSGKQEYVFEGFLEGTLSELPCGSGGFGYDSLFIPHGGEKTLAELSLAKKNAISHRRQAMDRLKEFLASLYTTPPC